MNAEHTFEIAVTVCGPVLVKSTAPSSFGVDAAVARLPVFGLNARGACCIPGTQLKGKLAEALAQIGRAAGPLLPGLEKFCQDCLGQDSDAEGKNNEPWRGQLRFDDLVAQTAEDDSRGGGTRHRISINEKLGSVEPQHLQVIEMPFAPGREVVFKGQARCFADDSTAAEIEKALRFSLSWLTQIGAARTVGFGRLLRVCVTRQAGRRIKVRSSATDAPHALDVVIRPLGPLCISKHKIGGNLFESEFIIPGNVLKGAVAETWAAIRGARLAGGVIGLRDQDRAELADCFEEIVFRHAFPTHADADRRPHVIPLSVVKGAKIETGADGNNVVTSLYRDVAGHDAPIVFRSGGTFSAPAFRADWKSDDYSRVDPAFGWAEPARELRVRTAIDSHKRRADKGKPGETPESEGKLFAWEMVHPCASDGKEIVWRTRIDLSAITDDKKRSHVTDQLVELLSILSFVSKTKAVCDVHPMTAAPLPLVTCGAMLSLVLQTPALLADPRFPEDTQPSQHGAISSRRMHELYRAAWSKLSEDSLELRHHFAAQSLAGGSYLFHRFQKPHGKSYLPWLLTDAGSVFVFDVVKPSVAETKLKEWLTRGLPLSPKIAQAFGGTWNTNPYLRENGFSEIAIHEPHPSTPAPGADEFEPAGLSPKEEA